MCTSVACFIVVGTADHVAGGGPPERLRAPFARMTVSPIWHPAENQDGSSSKPNSEAPRTGQRGTASGKGTSREVPAPRDGTFVTG